MESRKERIRRDRDILQVRKEGVRTCYRVIDPPSVRLRGVLKMKIT
jgi:hypothetical protein